MSTGLQALQKIVARMKGNPRYSQALTRPRRTVTDPAPQSLNIPLNRPVVTRGDLRSLVEAKGQNVGTIREQFPGMTQSFEHWMAGGADDVVLKPRRGSRDKLQALVDWLEGLT